MDRKVLDNLNLRIRLVGFEDYRDIDVTIYDPPDMEYVLPAALRAFNISPSCSVTVHLSKAVLGDKFHRVSTVSELLEVYKEHSISDSASPLEISLVPTSVFIAKLVFVGGESVAGEVTTFTEINPFWNEAQFCSNIYSSHPQCELQQKKRICTAGAGESGGADDGSSGGGSSSSKSKRQADREEEYSNIIITDREGTEYRDPATVRNGDVLFVDGFYQDSWSFVYGNIIGSTGDDGGASDPDLAAAAALQAEEKIENVYEMFGNLDLGKDGGGKDGVGKDGSDDHITQPPVLPAPAPPLAGSAAAHMPPVPPPQAPPVVVQAAAKADSTPAVVVQGVNVDSNNAGGVLPVVQGHAMPPQPPPVAVEPVVVAPVGVQLSTALHRELNNQLQMLGADVSPEQIIDICNGSGGQTVEIAINFYYANEGVYAAGGVREPVGVVGGLAGLAVPDNQQPAAQQQQQGDEDFSPRTAAAIRDMRQEELALQQNMAGLALGEDDGVGNAAAIAANPFGDPDPVAAAAPSLAAAAGIGQAVTAQLGAMGIILTADQLKMLTARVSSADAAVNYYFENMDKFM